MINDKVEITEDIINYIQSKVKNYEEVSVSNIEYLLSRNEIDFCKEVLLLIKEKNYFKKESYVYKLKHILETYILVGDYVSDYSLMLAIKELNMSLNSNGCVKFSRKDLFEAIYKLLENKGLYNIKPDEKEKFDNINYMLESFLKNDFMEKRWYSLQEIIGISKMSYKEVKISKDDLFKLIKNKEMKYKIEPYKYQNRNRYQEIYIHN